MRPLSCIRGGDPEALATTQFSVGSESQTVHDYRVNSGRRPRSTHPGHAGSGSAGRTARSGVAPSGEPRPERTWRSARHRGQRPESLTGRSRGTGSGSRMRGTGGRIRNSGQLRAAGLQRASASSLLAGGEMVNVHSGVDGAVLRGHAGVVRKQSGVPAPPQECSAAWRAFGAAVEQWRERERESRRSAQRAARDRAHGRFPLTTTSESAENNALRQAQLNPRAAARCSRHSQFKSASFTRPSRWMECTPTRSSTHRCTTSPLRIALPTRIREKECRPRSNFMSTAHMHHGIPIDQPQICCRIFC
jgi:hypothetical protein